MNILYIPTKDPRLTNGGNEQRTNYLWECLKKYGKVYSFLYDPNLSVDEDFIHGDHPIYIYNSKRRTTLFWSFINRVIERLSIFSVFLYKLYKFPSPEEVFGVSHFDIVITRYIYPVCYYPYWKIAHLYIDIDDHPIQVFETTKKNKIPLYLRTLGSIITRIQTNYVIKRTCGGWIANESQIEKHWKNYHYLPNIPNSPSIEYNKSPRNRSSLFTVGNMAYEPNYMGVDRVLTEIWPDFHKKYPYVVYYIAGKGAPSNYISKWSKLEGVNYLGFVDNIELLYQNCLATVVPIYSGGGTCIKTLESLSFSRVCISTSFGVRGIPKTNVNQEYGLLVFHDSLDFSSMYEIALDDNQRERSELKGHQFVSMCFSLDSFQKAVNSVLINHV